MVDQDASDIPGFSLDLAERLEATCRQDVNAPMFACHQSRDGNEFPCAGWLAVEGHRSIQVRLAVADGRIPAAALAAGDDWPMLEETWDNVIEKLRATAESPARQETP